MKKKLVSNINEFKHSQQKCQIKLLVFICKKLIFLWRI